MTSIEEPIRLRDYNLGSSSQSGVSRMDAQRHFRMSIALIALISVASLLASLATLSTLG